MAYPSACSLQAIGCRYRGTRSYWCTQARNVHRARTFKCPSRHETPEPVLATSCSTPGQHTSNLRNSEMCEIENVTKLTASPARIWSVLTDFSDYGNWRPLVQLSGQPALGATIDVIIQVGQIKKTFASGAEVTRFLRPNEFAWTAGMGRILLLEDVYTLTVDKAGTQLHHRIRFFGVMANLCCRLLRRRMLTVLVDADASLQRHLAGGNVPPTGNRRERRQQHHSTKHKHRRGR